MRGGGGVRLLSINQGGWRLQLVEYVFLNKAADDFFMDFYRAGKADGFACQAFNAGAERQVITLNALRKDLARQVVTLRNLSGIAAPVVAGYHTDGEGGQ